MKRVNIIGSGFSGLSCAAYLAKAGLEVHVYEKNEQPGGRAAHFSAEGFQFDMGPSWYWMPDVFEQFYNDFGHSFSDFYQLDRLDPSYRVFWKDEHWDIPASLEEMKSMFEKLETGSALKLENFLKEAKFKYDTGMKEFASKPSHSWLEYVSLKTLKASLRLDLLKSMSSHVRKYFKHPKIIQLLEFPVLFLGAKPQNTPALYSLMNYADICLGTWYPQGGMTKIVDAFTQICKEVGVNIHCNSEVSSIEKNDGVFKIDCTGRIEKSDYLVSSADYHHTDSQLIEARHSNYKEKYWESRTLAPSALIYYLGIDKKIDNLDHHNLFFDSSFDKHAEEIYDSHVWPSEPLFYVCCPSKTDESVAPKGMENIFLLMPISTHISDDNETREKYLDIMLDRLQEKTGTDIRPHIIYKRSFAKKDFQNRYHSLKGNAYGLANTLSQTGPLKPRIVNNKLPGMYYAGQLTVPGPGVPPSIMSGQIVANEIISSMRKS